MKKSIFYKLIFFVIALVSTQNLFAQFEEGKEEVYYARIKGDSLLTPTSASRTLICPASPGERVADRKIKNIITFKINEEDLTYLPASFTAVVDFDMVTSSNSTPAHKQLTVNYDKTDGAKYNVRDYIVLPAGDTMVKITVTGITPNNTSGFNPRLVLQLENEMRVLRYYNLATLTSLLTPSFNSPVNNIDAVNVSWNWDPGGATHNNMNQLEWAWVENEMAGYYVEGGVMNLDKLFAANATRVDLDFGQNNYNIPLLYGDTGKLYYRVRAALRKNDGSVFSGPWCMPASQYYAFNGHQPNLNWQSSTSFAENGKFKTVIQYFDGSLRNRQTVTKDNTTGNTVVAETIYDLQGRPNIQILPTPTNDNTIKFFPDFNRFVDMQQDEDPAKYFDLTPAVLQCKGALPLNITKGNGKYYSNNNPWLNTEPMAKYIPDATGTNSENKTGGFAYTETRFMDDATERVQSQSGVGLSHQIGSGHETKYYYGKPAQQELDALFGTEVGDFSHYSKNMVKDANGQMSISYTDMHGRTIATALAGDPTPGIDSIINPSDYPQASGLLTNQLLTPLSNNINGNSIESISTILAPFNTAYNFTYKLDPSILSQFSCTNQQICFDCKYDLEISIRSEDCGGVPIVRRYQNLQIVPANQACGTSMGFTGQGVNNVKQIDFSEFLTAGSWIVRKTLTINDSLFQIRMDSALKVFLCKTEQSIYDSVYNILYTTSGCGLPAGNTSACDSCMNHLGTYENYRLAYLISMGSVPGDHSHDAEIQVQYSADSTACANACGVLNIELTTLKSIRRQMLSDMMPYTGQYALPLDSIRGPNSPLSPQTDYTRTEAKYNIFTDHYLTGNTNNTKPKFYRLPVTETGAASYYYTEDNLVDSSVHAHDISNNVLLDTMNPPVFTSLFQPSWAKSLIYRHPEFTKLKYAEDNLASTYEWLDKVQGTDIYWGVDGAQNKHYDDPLGTVNPDPFFVIPANAPDKDTMNRRITQGVVINGSSTSGPSIWQMANSMVLCATADSAHKEACTNQMIITYPQSRYKMEPSITVDSLKDKVWEHFRSLYFSYRNELVLKYIDAHASNPLPVIEKDSLIKQGKTMNFATQEDVAAQNGQGVLWGNMNHPPFDTTGMGGAGSGTGINSDKCVAQRPLWKSKLKQCEELKLLLSHELHNDSVRVDNIINRILDGMVSVCHNSVNAQQPYGASNVNPAYTGLPQNFEAVINQVFADSNIHTLPGNNYFCNPYTIDYPKPYGKNIPVFTNYSNTIDSCGCTRFAALKLEAGPDSATFTSMNHFLLVNYNDTLTLPLWTGLQQCNNAWRDTCKLTYTTAGNNNSFSKTESASSCPVPVITGVTYDYNQYGLVINYIPQYEYQSCILIVYDENFNQIDQLEIICKESSVFYSSKDPCIKYRFKIQSYSDICGTKNSKLFSYNGCCPAPVITSVTGDVNNYSITINYITDPNMDGCILYIMDESDNVIQENNLDCGANEFVFNTETPCENYHFKIFSYSKTCGELFSDIFKYNGCCPKPVITSVTGDINSYSITVNYEVPAGNYNCTLYVMDVNDNILFTMPIECGETQAVLYETDPCQPYHFKITSSSETCESSESDIYNYTGCSSPCQPAVIYSATYINSTATNNIQLNYSTSNSFNNCTINAYANNSLVLQQSIACGSTSAILSLPPCQTYTFTISSFSKLCGSTTSNTVTLLPAANCGCPTPVISSVSILLPNPTNGTQNMRINYTIPAGGINCKIKAFVLGSTSPVLIQPITCANGSTVVNLAACNKYRFIVESDYSGISQTCGIRISDTARLDSCWKMTCTRLFTPIILPTVVVIPQFLNCGYVKPCITCGKLDSLTADFRALYPAYNAVPYLDSTATDEQGSENALWARYLNYKTGFSKNALDYMMAYKNCHTGPPPSTTIAICSFTKPLNDPGVFFPVDTLPCRTVQTQAQFVAYLLYQQMKDSLIARFDSLYKAKCFEAKNKEEFYVRYQPKEYHYTLYFYDQAGNLVKTLPPAAVKPNYDAAYLASVAAARNALGDVATSNNELLATNYRYNTLNQVINQKTPDAGISKFWYDRLGRLVVSQNAQQITANNYSYTLYDELGRITEVGQLYNSTQITQAISGNAGDATTTGSLANWLNNKPAEQITRTFYDKSYLDGNATLCPQYLCQKNLRNRVSYTGVYATGTPGSINEHVTATFYSYDIHGNVDTLLQDYKTGMGAIACVGNNPGNRFKKLVYSYDLISGKVNDVAYQPGVADQFYHRYFYDAENRITKVQTSKDKIYWEQDAAYSYYRHGPLARSVIGQNQVQGLDYAYNLQGWLKGVNSTSVGTGEYDMGQDGKTAAPNSLVARDAFGFSLNYFTGDYKPISTLVTPFVTVPMALPADPGTGISTGAQLFNGNIGAMAVNIPKLGNALVYGYRYDQLNRIVRMDAFTGFTNSNNTFTSPVRTTDYHEEVSYDPNGNIKTYNRNGSAATNSQNMDYLSYFYNKDGNGNLLNNRLRHVTDAYGYGNPTIGDIGTQAADNYTYDAIGNLIGDNAEGIASGNITWTVYGKIKSITKTNGTAISYTYDASGNRISKSVTNGGFTKSTYYVRDASGNVMSLYQAGDNTINNGDLSQTEAHLYGSNRLGVYNLSVDVQCTTSSTSTIFTRGNKFFEYTNHLGNVLVTVSDKKVGVDVAPADGVIDYYTADVVTASDYFPFGSPMPGRKYSQANANYRYGFNGMENDNEVKGEGNQLDFGERIYDSRLGRFLSPDPIGNEFPWNSLYAFAENDPIGHIDADGLSKAPPPGPGRGGKSGKKGGVTGLRSSAQSMANETLRNLQRANEIIRQREARSRRERMNRDPNFARSQNEFEGTLSSISKESYWRNAFNTAGSVFAGGGVQNNNKAGSHWENVVHATMLQNPNFIGVAKQISIKVTGTINGQTFVANIRVDNVGISKDASGKILFTLVEAKYSVYEITVNNVRQTLTINQKIADNILLYGTNVTIGIRGDVSAKNINLITNPPGAQDKGEVFTKDQIITGNITEITLVPSTSTTPKPKTNKKPK